MARTVTRSQVRTRAQLLADDTSGTIATSDQYDDWINESYAELWELLAQSGIYPDLIEGSVTVTSGMASAGDLEIAAGDVLNVIQVHWLEDAGNDIYVPLEPIHVNDWTRFDNVSNSDRPVRYLVRPDNTADKIRIFPKSAVVLNDVYRVLYVPACPVIAVGAGGDAVTINGVSGWEKFIAYDVAVKAKMKEGTSTTQMREERDLIRDRIEKASILRATEVPEAPLRSPNEYVDPADYFPYRRTRW